MEHEVQQRILSTLIHRPRVPFNELWGGAGESNRFAYHLRRLEEAGVVAKHADGYGLTAEGRRLSAFLEGETGGRAEFPTVAAMVFARRDGMLLCQQRLKEPFYGYWTLPGGKVAFGSNPDETAAREFTEETGLVARDPTLRVIEHIKTYEDGRMLHHHILYLYETWECEGTLLERTREGRNAWLTEDEYRQAKRFPGEWLFARVLPSQNVFIVDQVREMHGGSIVAHRTERIQELIRT